MMRRRSIRSFSAASRASFNAFSNSWPVYWERSNFSRVADNSRTCEYVITSPFTISTIQLIARGDFGNLAVSFDAQRGVADKSVRNERGDFVAVSFPCRGLWLLNEFRFVCGDKIEPQIDIKPELQSIAFQLRDRLLEQ